MSHWLRPTSFTGRGLIALAALLIAVMTHRHLSAAGQETVERGGSFVSVSATEAPSAASASAWADAQSVEELLARGPASSNPVPEPGTLNIILGTLAVLSALGVARVMSNRF